MGAKKVKRVSEAEPEFSDESLWSKIGATFKNAGKRIIGLALQLFYAAKRPDTPVWAKTVIYGALAYFISPIDAIPDITPVIGYSDDLVALTTALGTVASYIDDAVLKLSEEKLREWFG